MATAPPTPPPERKYQTWYEPSAAPSFWKQYSDRMWEHPIVPIALGTTCLILAGGLRSFIKGASDLSNLNHRSMRTRFLTVLCCSRETQNKWMRARLAAQGFTICAIAYYSIRPSEEKLKEEEKKRSTKALANQPEKPKDVVTIN